MDRILIRFNNDFEKDSLRRTWRIVIDGQESLAHKVHIRIPSETVVEEVHGVLKYNILCYGKVYWHESNMAVVDV